MRGRRWQAPLVTTLQAWPRRVALCAQRAGFSVTSLSLDTRKPAIAVVEDNFVDLENLYIDLAPSSHQTSSSASSRNTNVPAPTASVLGVTRVEPEEEDCRRSRLQLPLQPCEQTRAWTRPNTRVSLAPSEEARYADLKDTIEPSNSPDGNAPSSSPPTSPDGPPKLPVVVVHAEEKAGDGRLPDPAHLPYDDEKFAAMLLEMEVNGVIDETWQDANKAHVEDVKELAEILTALKVRDVCCIDVSEKTSNFDYMMFGTCEGARHIHLAAWAAQDADKVRRISKIKRKQTDDLWEVVPIGRIVLNLMVESLREEMALERKWAVTRTMDPLAAANSPISEGRQVKAHGLWTLTLNLQDLEDFEVDYCKDILMRQM